MTKATDLLLDIAAEKNGYSIGEPWRFTEFSLAAIIPITRETEASRAYRLLSEAGSDVLIKDTGDISKMEITNNGGLPVLLKSGELVVGATQTRTLAISQVIVSGEKVIADCLCTHATKGIRAGQKVKVGGYSPSTVRRAVYTGFGPTLGPQRRTSYRYNTGLQHGVWGEVKAHSRTTASSGARFMAAAHSGSLGGIGLDEEVSPAWSTPLEDLAGRVEEGQKKFEAALRSIPIFEHQVGMALISLDGLETLESFEHPGSWESLRKSVLKAEAGKIADVTDQDSVFMFRPEKAKAAIRELLTSNFEESMSVDKPATSTFLLKASKFTGEVVTLYGQPIHCVFVRAG